MNKSLLAFVSLNFLAINTFSQSINFDNIPSAGETYQYSRDTNFVAQGSAGNSAIWDFSSLTFPPILDNPENYLLPSQTGLSSTYPSSNLVEGTVADTNFTFYKVSGNSFEIVGITFGATNVSFSNSMKLTNLPFGFGASSNDNFTGTFTVFSFTANISGTVNSQCDGLGQLILPGAAPIQALRVKTIISQTTSIAFVGDILINNTTQYNWYDPTTKNYIFSVSKDSSISSFPSSEATTVVSFSSSKRNTNFPAINTSSVKELNLIQNLELFPNPSFGIATVTFNAKISEAINVSVFDVSGKLIHKINEFGNGSISKVYLETSNWEKGIYFVQITQDKYQVTKKLVVR